MLDKIFNNENLTPSSELTDGRINYEFKNGIKAYQEELEVEESSQLAKVLGDVGFEDVTIAGFIGHLLSKEVLQKMLAIILKAETDTEDVHVTVGQHEVIKTKPGPDYGTLKASELWSVISDFFILNPLVKKLLESSANELVSKSMTPST